MRCSFSSSSSFPPSWPGLRNVGTVYGCRLQTIQTGTQEPVPAFPQRKKKLVVWFLCCGALCAAEGKHDRQQGCNFDTSFVRRRQTNLLARLLSVFFLYLSPQFGSDCWPCMKEWKIGAPIGTSKVIHLPFLNFFLFFYLPPLSVVFTFKGRARTHERRGEIDLWNFLTLLCWLLSPNSHK